MFRLHKWYLDLVTDRGDAFIGYAAHLEWGGLGLDYASTLYLADGSPRESQTIRRVEEPRLRSDAISWQTDRLGVCGQWRRDTSPIQRTLVDDAEGEITWTCHMPRASATVRLGDEEIVGLGYVESLSLTVPPSKLPFRTLRWGRHVSPEHSLVWIDWAGDIARRWIWLDGDEQHAAILVDGAPSGLAGTAALRLSDTRDMRNAPVLASIGLLPPALTRRLGGGVASMHEHKQVSRSSLVIGERALDRGWTLHEVVTR